MPSGFEDIAKQSTSKNTIPGLLFRLRFSGSTNFFTCKKLASKLANAKAKLELLSCGIDADLFSSLHVHVGKFYEDNGLEEQKSVILKNCQKELLELSRIEAVDNLRMCREN